MNSRSPFLNDVVKDLTDMKNQTIKLALVCTIGGHFEQLTNLVDLYSGYRHFWITNQNKQTLSQLAHERKYFVPQAHFKEPWTYLFQLPKMLSILLAERPTHILSTGSGRTALIPFLLAKSLNIKFLYIDTFSRVNGYSKFGTFLLKLGHPIFSQWEDRGNRNVRYIGPIFKRSGAITKKNDSDYVFVAVGTRKEPFARLIQAVETLVKQGVIPYRVVVQAGHTHYATSRLKVFEFCTPDEIDDLITNAQYVITQESAGIGTKCLKFNTKFFVMPRDYQYGELPAQSDMKEDLHLKLEEMGYTRVVHSTENLASAICDIASIKCGFEFDNRKALETLLNELETE